MEHFLKGLAIGFAVAAPVGPINVLCLRRSIADGRRVGFVSGLGAAAADTTCATVAAVSLTTVLTFLTVHRTLFQLLQHAGPLLLEFFFQIHDPSTRNRQGNDVGTQYRSAIYTFGDAQRKAADEARTDVGIGDPKNRGGRHLADGLGNVRRDINTPGNVLCHAEI